MDPRNPFGCFDRRYAVETLIAMVALLGLTLIGKRFPAGTATRIAFGVAETVVFGYMIAGTFTRLRRLDEMQQRIHLIAIAVSFGVTGIVITGAEFMRKAGVHVPPMGVWLWVFMAAVWGIGVFVVSRRYR